MHVNVEPEDLVYLLARELAGLETAKALRLRASQRSEHLVHDHALRFGLGASYP